MKPNLNKFELAGDQITAQKSNSRKTLCCNEHEVGERYNLLNSFLMRRLAPNSKCETKFEQPRRRSSSRESRASFASLCVVFAFFASTSYSSSTSTSLGLLLFASCPLVAPILRCGDDGINCGFEFISSQLGCF